MLFPFNTWVSNQTYQTVILWIKPYYIQCIRTYIHTYIHTHTFYMYTCTRTHTIYMSLSLSLCIYVYMYIPYHMYVFICSYILYAHSCPCQRHKTHISHLFPPRSSWTGAGCGDDLCLCGEHHDLLPEPPEPETGSLRRWDLGKTGVRWCPIGIC